LEANKELLPLIDDRIELAADLQAYREHYMLCLDEIAKEPNLERKRYYGKHLEDDIVQKLSNPEMKNDNSSLGKYKDELIGDIQKLQGLLDQKDAESIKSHNIRRKRKVCRRVNIK
jgi:hypothetical protein